MLIGRHELTVTPTRSVYLLITIFHVHPIIYVNNAVSILAFTLKTDDISQRD